MCGNIWSLSLVFVRGADFCYHAFFSCVRITKGDKVMADYESLYYQLFNKITDVIEELKEVQQQAEEMYINTSSVGDDESNQV